MYPQMDLLCVNKWIFISIYTEHVGVMCEMNSEDLRCVEHKTRNVHSGGVGEMHRNLSFFFFFFFLCTNTIFFHWMMLSSEMVTKPFILGLLLLLQLVRLVFCALHGAASETFLSDASSSRQQGAAAEQTFPSGCWTQPRIYCFPLEPKKAVSL